MTLQTPPLPEAESITLEDGTPIVVRPIQPNDAAYLQKTFLQLSAQTVFFRFLTHKRNFTETEAHQYADVDYTTRMAFVATSQVDGKEAVLGVARYALIDPAHPETAEAAVVVADEYHGRGIGRHLLWPLVVYARQAGIQHLRAAVLLENNRILGIIQHSGLPYQKRYVDGLWEIIIDLGE